MALFLLASPPPSLRLPKTGRAEEFGGACADASRKHLYSRLIVRTIITSRASVQPPKASSLVQPTYTYPDPIPEFADSETTKFRNELRKKLVKNKETFGDDITEVINVCSEIFNNFLHQEYGGPGTLVVEPFTDMLLALKEKKLPGASIAARAALLWAQNYVDRDWELWTSQPPQS